MKKPLIFITLVLAAISTYAQTNTKLDSLHTVINSEVYQTTRGLEEQITLINTEIKANKEQQQQALKSLGDSTKSMIGDSLGGVRTQLSNLVEKEVSALSSLIKSQNKEMAKLNGSIVTLKEQLDGNLTKMNSQLDSLDSGLGDANKQLETTQQSSELARQDIKDNILYLLGAICIILILIIVVYWLTHKKHTTAQNEIADAKTHLEEQINTANADFAEKLLEAMNKLPKPGEAGETSQNPEDNQGLILDFAQHIAKMENNIWNLPEDDRMRKKIENSTRRMRDTFKSLGYDMANLLGTEVSDNQIIEIRNRKEDTSIAPGKVVIIRVVKPLVLFNGKPISGQRPIVDVKENIEN